MLSFLSDKWIFIINKWRGIAWIEQFEEINMSGSHSLIKPGLVMIFINGLLLGFIEFEISYANGTWQ